MRFEDDTGTVIEGEGVGGGWADCYFAFDYFQLLLVYCDIIRLEFSQNTNIRVILRNCMIFFFCQSRGYGNQLQIISRGRMGYVNPAGIYNLSHNIAKLHESVIVKNEL